MSFLGDVLGEIFTSGLGLGPSTSRGMMIMGLALGRLVSGDYAQRPLVCGYQMAGYVDGISLVRLTCNFTISFPTNVTRTRKPSRIGPPWEAV